MPPTSARDSLEAEWAVLRPWIDTVPPEAMDRQSVLAGWTVRDLVAHVASALTAVSNGVPDDASADLVVPADYVAAYGRVADGIAEGARSLVRDHGEDLGALLDASWAGLVAAAETWGEDERRVVRVRRGPVRMRDLIHTRTLELVVHGDDLARSVPEVAPPVHDRGALRDVVKVLLEVLVARAPGGSVEVRVPPFAAVQVVEGTAHTRGTPPNTVETDPLTWIRVACGRRSWDEAVADGSLRVSGVRAVDVSRSVPLL